jgi:hypothetical protein
MSPCAFVSLPPLVLFSLCAHLFFFFVSRPAQSFHALWRDRRSQRPPSLSAHHRLAPSPSPALTTNRERRMHRRSVSSHPLPPLPYISLNSVNSSDRPPTPPPPSRAFVIYISRYYSCIAVTTTVRSRAPILHLQKPSPAYRRS